MMRRKETTTILSRQRELSRRIDTKVAAAAGKTEARKIPKNDFFFETCFVFGYRREFRYTQKN